MPKVPRLLKWIGSIVVIFFLLLTLFRFVFYWAYKPMGTSFPAKAFGMGARLDLRIVCILGLVMLVLCIIPYVNPFRRSGARRFWKVALTVIFFLLTFFYIIDYFHYDYLHQRLNASAMNYMQDAGISMQMVWQTYPVIPILVGIIVLMAGAVYVFSRLIVYFQIQSPAKVRRRGIWTALFALLLFIGTWGSLGQFALRWSDVFSLGDAFKAQLALNPVQSFFSTLSFKNSSYDTKKALQYYSLMADYLGVKNRDSANLDYTRYETPKGPATFAGKPNIVLVICESFSAYKSSMWGNPLNPTPFFDSMCRSGVFFDRCFTPTYGTARGVWATVTGIPDVEAPKTASRNPALVDQNTILNDFTDYEKYYFIGGSASWANIRGVLKYNINGLHLYEQEDYDAGRVDVWGISDKNLLLNANRIMARQQKPFFTIIQTADNHRPYTIPEEDMGAFRKVQVPQDTLKKYGFVTLDEFNAFRYTDFCFQQFMEAAQKEPYFKNSVFVFIGDHGIRGDAGNMLPKAWTNQALTTVHTPLLFYAPGILPPSRHSNVCSQLDVLPSIAGLVSRPFRNTGMGRNLFDSSLARHPFRYSSAFIADPDEKKIGMMSDDYYLRKQINKPVYELVSLKNNDPVPPGRFHDSVQNVLATYVEAYYQTARYLLYNNKKSGSASGGK